MQIGGNEMRMFYVFIIFVVTAGLLFCNFRVKKLVTLDGIAIFLFFVVLALMCKLDYINQEHKNIVGEIQKDQKAQNIKLSNKYIDLITMYESHRHKGIYGMIDEQLNGLTQ